MNLLQVCVSPSEDTENLTIQDNYVLDSAFSYRKKRKGKRKSLIMTTRKKKGFSFISKTSAFRGGQ